MENEPVVIIAFIVCFERVTPQWSQRAVLRTEPKSAACKARVLVPNLFSPLTESFVVVVDDVVFWAIPGSSPQE